MILCAHTPGSESRVTNECDFAIALLNPDASVSDDVPSAYNSRARVRPARPINMKLFVRRILLLTLALALAGGIVYAFLPQPVNVETSPVDRGMMRVTVDEEGKTRVKERYIVAAPLTGRLERIELKSGDAVQANDTVLARIQPTAPDLLDVRQTAQAKARVQAAQAAVERNMAMLERARESLNWAQREHERLQQALASTAASPREVDLSAVTERTATQELRAAQFARDVSQFELDQARAALLRIDQGASPSSSEVAAGQFEIRSPITGKVLRVIQESERVVTPGEPLIEIGDPACLEVVIDVLSSDAVKIPRGAVTSIERWGGDKPLSGTVRLVEPSAFTKISALGVEEQRVNVIIDFDVPEAQVSGALGDGYRVDGRIVIWEQPDVLKVPTSALFRQGDEWSVFVIDDARASLRKVMIGRQNGWNAQVLDGLQPGERVILHPSDKVRDGVRVAVR